MPLSDGYRVGIGTFNRFYTDPEEEGEYGDFLHGHIVINVPTATGGTEEFRAAVDVNSLTGGIDYFMPTNLDKTKFTTISTLPNGYRNLPSTSISGALDYKRNPLISVPLGCLALILALFGRRGSSEWTRNTGPEALSKLRSMFENPADIERVYLFGEPFTYDGLGVHNVHCNQGNALPVAGDPDYGRKLGWYRESGIWQDGGILVKYRTDDRLAGFFVKFTVQTLNTDDNGHPI